jgi:IS1 family transposase/transposase-like protein
MVVSACSHESSKKHGKDRNGNQRHRCLICGKTFIDAEPKPLGDMRIEMKDAVLALNLLLEGMSIRAVERLTSIHRDTICNLILVVGANCQRLLDSIRDVEATDVQCDEIWSFVGMKEKQRIGGRFTGDEGNSWTFIAIDRETKLILAHEVGQRDNETCGMFLRKLRAATSGRLQLSTDGLAAYTLGVPFTFQGRVDFGQLIKNFGGGNNSGRYSPARLSSAEKRPMYGAPDHDRICTSHIERFNLTLRMNVRRFTRLTNAHSKSLKHHAAMQAIFFAFYNFVRKHEAIKTTPAVAAGLAAAQWSLKDLIQRAGAA